MMYYIESPNTWSPANQKCKQLQEFVDLFRNTLIADELSRDALVEEIRHRVELLNETYPRTKKLAVDHHNNYVSCFPEDDKLHDTYVFTIHLHPVRRTYRFSEEATAPLLSEGGEQ